MPQELTAGMKAAKEIERSLVQNENRLAYIQSEVKRLSEAKEKVEADIKEKMSNYDIFIAQRDSESKKIRQAVMDDRDQLAKEKEEFKGILAKFQAEKATHLESVQGFETNKTRNEAQMNNIREFIIAIQRACSLLGL